MRVHHLNCGTMSPPLRRLVNGTGGLLDRGRMVCHCLLVESDDGLVLVDAGFGLADLRRPAEHLGRWFLRQNRPLLDPAETAVRQVERLGHAAGDVRHIIVTHLDVDHAGGLADFPHAEVHVSAAELAAARHPATALERRRYRTAQWAHGPRWAEYGTGGDRWHGFTGVREIPGLPGLLLVPLAGHTRGHTGVAVDTGREGAARWLVHAGDAYFHHDQLAPDRHRCPPGLRLFQSLMQADRAARLANLGRLRALAAGGAAEIFSAHDPVELDRFRPATPDQTAARPAL
ncbi:MBL fold metallo-hydrolase [Sphaerisporangium rufum]|uniref:MBL fold metallo-hydrolase n=1 Tax=Sphaerisporangium rufum TaxID=1381558 RepID=A0A919R6F9_9ACTN|nr:MBL fold metallo-hydrolase [Sphaerisporangium rufum]GII80133.1 MBL fold metallo-hydrolase [Sphaerisporangium rufum]